MGSSSAQGEDIEYYTPTDMDYIQEEITITEGIPILLQESESIIIIDSDLLLESDRELLAQAEPQLLRERDPELSTEETDPNLLKEPDPEFLQEPNQELIAAPDPEPVAESESNVILEQGTGLLIEQNSNLVREAYQNVEENPEMEADPELYSEYELSSEEEFHSEPGSEIIQLQVPSLPKKFLLKRRKRRVKRKPIATKKVHSRSRTPELVSVDNPPKVPYFDLIFNTRVHSRSGTPEFESVDNPPHGIIFDPRFNTRVHSRSRTPEFESVDNPPQVPISPFRCNTRVHARSVTPDLVSADNPPLVSISDIFNTKVHSRSVTPELVSADNPLHMPIHPDVRFKTVPFFDVLFEILRPSSLIPKNSDSIQENSFIICLTPQQAESISASLTRGLQNSDIQIHLRVCLLETTSEQEDYFPVGLVVKVNNKVCSIQSSKKKKDIFASDQCFPINITPYMIIGPDINEIDVRWRPRCGRSFVVGVYLVEKKTSEDLLNRLKYKVRNADHTKGMIKDKLAEDADAEILTTSLRVSVVCPLGKMRLKFPCRASTCQHLQCFDASLYLQMNEKKPTWICPVCDCDAKYENLIIDGYFLDILSAIELLNDVTEIELHRDGSWSPLTFNKGNTIRVDSNAIVKTNGCKEDKSKMTGKNISLDIKMQVLRRLENGERQVDIGKALNLSPSTIRTIIKNKDKIKLSVTTTTSSFSKLKTTTTAAKITRSRSNILEEMEKRLCIWIDDEIERNMPLSPIIIMQKAIKIFNYVQGEDTSENFTADRDWFDNFKKKTNLHNVRMNGEAVSADTAAASIFPATLKSIIERGNYPPKLVFNVDETELFWKRMPKRTFISLEEKRAPGFKAGRDRCTLLLGGNANGDFKLKPLVVYRAKTPRSMMGILKSTLPIIWEFNKKSWITRDIFQNWFTKHFCPSVKRYCDLNRFEPKALLLLDNAASHSINPSDLITCIPVEIVFLPRNTTSLIQPMNQGVIANFKAHYFSHTFQQLINKTAGGDKETILQCWKNYNILDAISNIDVAWQELTKKSMNGAWKNIWPEVSRDYQRENFIVGQIANLVERAGLGYVDEQDIEELLNVSGEGLGNEDLKELADQGIEEGKNGGPEGDEPKVVANDPNFNRSSKGRGVLHTTGCYGHWLNEWKRTRQMTQDDYLAKKSTISEEPRNWSQI